MNRAEARQGEDGSGAQIIDLRSEFLMNNKITLDSIVFHNSLFRPHRARR